LAWKVEIDPSAARELSKIDRTWQQRILSFIEEIPELPHPRSRGRALTGTLAGYWRYRVGDYRILCDIQDDVLTVRAVKVAHRRNVYD
jgi:mRNA interferase RelE/StbE